MSNSSPLKYVGSKQNLIPTLQKILPKNSILVEPFCGAVNVFLNYRTNKPCILNDINFDIYNFLVSVRDADDFEVFENLFVQELNNELSYYQIRTLFNYDKKVNGNTISLEQAARLLYMNKFGYRGLLRYNSSGEFNVPFGHYPFRGIYYPQAELIYLNNKLQNAILMNEDFRKCFEYTNDLSVKDARSEFIIFCDPPYVNTSTVYGDTFKESDRLDLIKLAETNHNIVILCDNEDNLHLYNNATSIINIKGNHNIKKTARSEIIAIYKNVRYKK